jgi:hypothetical protein
MGKNVGMLELTLFSLTLFSRSLFRTDPVFAAYGLRAGRQRKVSLNCRIMSKQ